MNYSTAVFIINKHVRGVHCRYVPAEGDPGYDKNAAVGKKDREVSLFKTLDPAVSAGDLVVVPTKTRHGFTVVRVVEVDVEVDFDSKDDCQWVAARFDPSEYQQTLEQEKVAVDKLRVIHANKRRRELAADIAAVDKEELNRLKLVDFNGS